MKAEQAVERTAGITDYHQFLSSPGAMDLFDATILRVQVVGEMPELITVLHRIIADLRRGDCPAP